MTRAFILISEGLTNARQIYSTDEAVSEMVMYTEPDHTLRTTLLYSNTLAALEAAKSGTVFELEYHPQTNAPTVILVVVEVN